MTNEFYVETVETRVSGGVSIEEVNLPFQNIYYHRNSFFRSDKGEDYPKKLILRLTSGRDYTVQDSKRFLKEYESWLKRKNRKTTRGGYQPNKSNLDPKKPPKGGSVLKSKKG